jgi:23S rRNA pseudouridine1911/1915/1917 synthase
LVFGIFVSVESGSKYRQSFFKFDYFRAMNFQVIYEDNHLIAVNKPAGELVQGDETGDTPLVEQVKQYIKVRYKKPGDVFLGVVHRLDRPVSGAVIFARTSKALERMNKLFADRHINKVYWAIVKDRPKIESDTLIHYLDKDRSRNVTLALDAPSRRHPDAKRSELQYELMATLGHFSMLEVRPTTGRPHQIRAQLSKIGSPIRGDVKYGYPTPNVDGSIHLHCRAMRFVHPIKQEAIEIIADPPNESIWNQFAKIMV